MTQRTGCREAVARMWAYLDRELAPAERDDLEQHLAFCLRCCGELEFARALRRRLATATPPPPTDVRDRLEAFLDDLDPPDRTAAVGPGPTHE